MYAIALAQAGSEIEALAAGRRAIALGTTNPQVPKLVERLEARKALMA